MKLLVVIPKGLRSFAADGVEVVIDRRVADRRKRQAGRDHGQRGTGIDRRAAKPGPRFEVPAVVTR